MDEGQSERIIGLLKNIEDRLAKIESNTFDIPTIESNIDDLLDRLKQLENKLR